MRLRAACATGVIALTALVLHVFTPANSATERPATGASPAGSQGAPKALHADSPSAVADQMREALLAGHPVQVEYRAGKDREADRYYWCRLLTEAERQRAIRHISIIHRTTDRAFELEGSDDIDREKEMTNQFRIRAMADAARILLEDGQAFLTKGPISLLQSNDRWHYWSMSFHTSAEGDLWVNVPIDLDRFPQVRGWRQREQEMNQFAETEAAYRWNSLDYTVRQRMVADGNLAREKMLLFEQEAKELNAVPREQRTAEQIARSIALGEEMKACQQVTSRVPRRLDPMTLEWKL
ncbi:MAG: hypothetical protein K8J09_03865 [Planctomycetes bacterium]|nr:hypothetical protein [Planctomycetota bacterium]